MSTSLFGTDTTQPAEDNASRPLADRLRPQKLDDVIGQDHLIGDGAPLRKMIENGALSSIIFWGPPGCGKTTLARILANHTELKFEQISAIFSGVGDLKKLFESARIRKQNGQGTLLFVDEIHRFNKSQQDAFLPVVEDGTITLIGATTENPSFELNAAILSRSQVFVLKRLDDMALDGLLSRAEESTKRPLPLNDDARQSLKAMADGDGRYCLSLAEQVYIQAPDDTIWEQEQLFNAVQKRAPIYDKGDDSHYNLISALHKSMRGSDVEATLYWFSRMLDGGEDPKYIARRMVRMAVEDIGLADPQALAVCMSAWDAYDRLGSPEGELALTQAMIYLATAPKSNAAYKASKLAMVTAKKTGSLMPPKHILNAPTQLMKSEGYNDGYIYDPDTKDGFSGQDYFPEEMERTNLYQPVERGFEREIKKRVDYWNKLRERKQHD